MDNEADEQLTRWVVRQMDGKLDRQLDGQLDIRTVRLMDYHTGGQTEE
jgi:hypothetical protein